MQTFDLWVINVSEKHTASIFRAEHVWIQYLPSHLGGVVVSVLATRSKVADSNPAKAMDF
jgi:hypothetical protein